jgi:hypothetical protein
MTDAVAPVPVQESSEVSPRYRCCPLDKSRKEIRLLTLEPGTSDEILRCTLSHAYIDISPMLFYKTISYVCGDPALRSTIMLHGNDTDVLASSEIALRRGTFRLSASHMM